VVIGVTLLTFGSLATLGTLKVAIVDDRRTGEDMCLYDREVCDKKLLFTR
jgi:hypothetical protein